MVIICMQQAPKTRLRHAQGPKNNWFHVNARSTSFSFETRCFQNRQTILEAVLDVHQSRWFMWPSR